MVPLVLLLEEGNMEFKYKDEFRDLEVSTLEDALGFTRKKELAQIQKIEDKITQSINDSSTVNPRQAALLQLMKDVQEQHIKNKSLEQEIVSLKSQVDAVQQAKAKAARARGARDTKGKKKGGNEHHEQVWKDFLKTQGLVVEETEGASKILQIQKDGSLTPHPEWLKSKKSAVVAEKEVVAE